MKTRIPALIFLLITIASNTLIAGELEERKAIQERTAFLLSSKNFGELERLAQEYRVNRSRTPSGVWKLTCFYTGIRSYFANFNSKDDWSSIKSTIEEWIKEYPKSPTPYISHAILMREYAWKFRGGGLARTVPEEAWQPFFEHLNIAKAVLEKNKEIASTDPHWYDIMANIAIGLSLKKSEFLTIVNEGLEKEPLYIELYCTATFYFTPKWHGNAEEIEEFANFAVARTKENEGLGMYARVYWAAKQYQYGERLFIESNVVWGKMKKGIDDVLKRYPDQWNINNFTLFACLAKDRDKARELFQLVNEPPFLAVWKSNSNYLGYKSWAYAESGTDLPQGQMSPVNKYFEKN